MRAAVETDPPSQIDAEVQRIRSLLQQSRYEPALAAALALKPTAPGNRDVLYMIAVAERYLERIPDALATLAELERYHPQFSRLFQERGNCHVALRQPGPAIDAFLQAVTLNPSLPASWRALQALYKMAGQQAYSDDAGAHLANLAALPPAIVTAFDLYADGLIGESEDLLRQFLLTEGDHVEAMRLLAKIGAELDVLDDAEYLLQNVLLLAPAYHAARYEYAMVLERRHKHLRANEEIDKLLAIDPDNTGYRTTKATILMGFSDYDHALPLYRQSLARTPQDAELHLSIAHALKTLGLTDEAIESYRTASAVRPGYGEAYWSLANLKTYRFTEEELARMRTAEGRPQIDRKDRYHLCFALGKALEDRADYAASFEYYERGNALKKTECKYRPQITERNTRLQIAVCTERFIAAREGFGYVPVPPLQRYDATPIFIVGLPRSGSTLVEQILASHSQAEGTMELADIPRMVQDIQGRDSTITDPKYPAMLSDLNADDYRRLGQQYLEDTLVYRTGKPFFIDKMPNNFRHLGLIHLMFPNARIIDARREPLACCFSNFKQLFASGQQFTYSVDDIARYYLKYVELMAHWDAVLPGRVLRIQHEDLVGDLEPNVRRILAYCGLEFEQACVEFHKTKRTIHTASSEQVRRPINRDGLDQWRHYEPWLGPLKEALGIPQ